MKKLYLLILNVLCFSTVFGQFEALFGSTETGNLRKIEVFTSEKQLDSIYRKMQVPVLVIGTYTYVPYEGCVVKRRSGGSQEERMAGGSNKNRLFEGNNQNRNMGAQTKDRTLDGDNLGRNKDGNNKKRNKDGGTQGRTDEGGEAQRSKDAANASRTGDGGNADRAGDGGNAGRTGDGSKTDRDKSGSIVNRNDVSGGTLQIQCKKIKNSSSFELINISEKAKIKVYDVMGLRENVGTIVEYF